MEQTLKETNQLLKKLIKRRSIGYSFLLGMANSFGATVGLVLVFALLAYVLRQLPLVPMIGDWLSEVMNNTISKIDVPVMF